MVPNVATKILKLWNRSRLDALICNGRVSATLTIAIRDDVWLGGLGNTSF
jgi:hypothetical protein